MNQMGLGIGLDFNYPPTSVGGITCVQWAPMMWVEGKVSPDLGRGFSHGMVVVCACGLTSQAHYAPADSVGSCKWAPPSGSA
jgi:hypothetical protein